MTQTQETLHTINPEAHEVISSKERHEKLRKHHEQLGTETKQEHLERLAEARMEAHEEAASVNPMEKLKATENAGAPTQPLSLNSELRAITLRRELQHIRRKLSKPQQTLSKVVHQPLIRAVSEGAGKTVSRPSGLLGGGIVSFVGVATYYLLVRHMGYAYNNAIFFMLFIGGFIAGVIIEMLVHYGVRASNRQLDN